jgi:hypothetical protein
MSPLLGPDGNPISSKTYGNKKVDPPSLGEKYGAWGGPTANIMMLPGGGALQFDLNALTLSDYRQMRDHYQINSSLSLLMFLLHQVEWKIECDDPKQRDFYTEQMEYIWTPLVRSKSQAFWSGFSPNVLQWQNDIPARRVVIDKIKDLIPEEVEVHWKKVDGAGTHKISVYDGIQNLGHGGYRIAPDNYSSHIPVENTYWYPLLMENGNYYGRKLLRSAFQPWFFSLLVHLFANRYYERFGEPTPIGRAPYEDEVRFQGKEMRGNAAMEIILQNLRNRTAVVLPNDKTPFGDETTLDYDYQIEYLESQMRGADFERYMTRLDEEMSLALFTPILMMRTADVGSYNLGTQHNQTYKLLLNALTGDWKYYIDWYLLRPLRDYNFGTNADLPRIKFRKLGAENETMMENVLASVISSGKAKPDIEQLGEMVGLKLTEVRELTADPANPEDPSSDPASDPATGGDATENRQRVRSVANALSRRLSEQVANAFKKDKLRTTEFDLGFQSRFESALRGAGVFSYVHETQRFYDTLNTVLRDMVHMQWESPEEFMRNFDISMNWKIDSIFGEV